MLTLVPGKQNTRYVGHYAWKEWPHIIGWGLVGHSESPDLFHFLITKIKYVFSTHAIFAGRQYRRYRFTLIIGLKNPYLILLGLFTRVLETHRNILKDHHHQNQRGFHFNYDISSLATSFISNCYIWAMIEHLKYFSFCLFQSMKWKLEPSKDFYHQKKLTLCFLSGQVLKYIIS